MTTTSLSPTAPAAAASGSSLYRAIWRWHFYAGLVVAPFLTILALTGLIMLYGNSIETFLGKKYLVVPGGSATLEQQAAAAVAAVPDSNLKLVVRPAKPDRATVVLVTLGDQEHAVSVDPNGAKVVGQIVKDDTWFYFANRIHGKLLIGDVGDRIMEICAGLGIVLVLSGLYLWWPRGERSFPSSDRPPRSSGWPLGLLWPAGGGMLLRQPFSQRKDRTMKTSAHRFAVATLGVVAMSAPALAHAHLKSAMPAAGSIVTAPPTALDLKFSEGLNLKFTGVKVTGPDKASVATGDASLGANDDTALVVPVSGTMGAGTYTVTWHALSDDGHKTNGSYKFTVKP